MDNNTAQAVDMVLDRNKQRKRANRWRFLFIGLLIIAVIGVVRFSAPVSFGPHIARFEVNGFIASDPYRDMVLREIAEDDMAKALIVAIDSPGGTIVGSEDLYTALRDVAKKKPVVAVMGGLAASGGYITAIGADHIIARRNTLTGSIGVLFQAPQMSALMEKIGVSMETYKSGTLKAVPSPFEETTPAAAAHMEELVADGFNWFHGLVVERRSLGENAALAIADGRVFTGAQALDLGLVDSLGNEEDARIWLASEHKLDDTLDVIDINPEPLEGPFSVSESLANAFLGLFGLEKSAKTLESKGLFVDGLMALWHP